MTRLQTAFSQVVADLDQVGCQWAVVGGLAVSARAEPRSTRDVDIAVVVRDDAEAERVSALLAARGYRIDAALEHTMTGRMATVRFRSRGETAHGVLVDLFFASSGVEAEIVASAEILELWPGTSAPVATVGHLLALKVLAFRPRDLDDISWLLKVAGDEDIAIARQTLELIRQRGFAREKDLPSLFAEARRAAEESDGPFRPRDRSR